MSPLLLWSSLVLAAAPTARVAGVSGVRSVAVLLERDGVVAGAACNDAGAAPDAGADGIYTCGPLPPVTGAVRVGLVRDGRLVDAGEATLGAAGLALRVDGGTVVLGDASVLGAPRPGAPAPAVPTAFARVRVGADGSAPVVRLQGSAGASELTCRDDGVFPDAERNDGEHGCAGAAPGTRADVYLNGGGNGSYGTVAWDPASAFAFIVVDAASQKARAETFALPRFAPRVDAAATHTVVPLDTPPGAGLLDPLVPGSPLDSPGLAVPPAPPEAVQPPAPPAPEPVQPPDPVPTEKAGHSPVASRSIGQMPPLAVLAVVALGLGGGFALRRRAHRLPSTLRPHPAPALVPGGPTLADGACALRTPDPDALAAVLLPALARHRRVVVVAAPDAVLPEVADGPVYRATSGDCEEIEAAALALARAPGPPVAVLVVGDVLTDAGAVAPSPARKLKDGLPPGMWLGVVATAAPPGLPAWDVSGPPWHAEVSS